MGFAGMGEAGWEQVGGVVKFLAGAETSSDFPTKTWNQNSNMSCRLLNNETKWTHNLLQIPLQHALVFL